MKFTLSWLKSHLKTDKSVNEICDALTTIGLELEELIDPSVNLNDFIIAQIVDAMPHPNADKLQICQVDFGGEENIQIVCGAKNARAGLKTVLAPIGTYIAAHDFKIKKSKIRDIESNGMMCSFDEMGLDGDNEGIIEINDNNAKPGTKYIDYNPSCIDPIIEICITPNRGDCLGVAGIAKDLAAYGFGEIIVPDYLKNSIVGDFTPQKTITTNTDNCSHVVSREIKNIKNIETPNFIKERLSDIGINPKNFLVDLTNYISFDIGKPTHAFDLEKVENLEISTSSSDVFDALDDKQYNIESPMTVVKSGNNVVALAGILGGKESSVSDTTTSILLESAVFDGVNIAKTGRKLGIISDARYRYERHVNPASNQKAVDMFTNILLAHTTADVSTIFESGAIAFANTVIEFDINHIHKTIGIQIPKNTIEKILVDLGFGVNDTAKENIIKIDVPSHRPDIEGKHCIVEEVMRIYGVDNIPSAEIKFKNINCAINSEQKRIFNAKRIMASIGYNEMVNFSFISKPQAELFTDNLSDNVVLLNPISNDLNTMRPSIIPSILINFAKNINKGNSNLKYFEYGGTYFGNKVENQMNVLCAVICGNKNNKSWKEKQTPFDFFDIKADLYNILERIGINTSSLIIKRSDMSYMHPGQSADLYIGKIKVATFGKLHPTICEKFDVIVNTFAFEIFMNNLYKPKKSSKSKPAFKQYKYQSVKRDFSFEVDREIFVSDIIRTIKSCEQKLIEKIDVIDEYIKDIESKTKSIAVSVLLRSENETLNDEQITNVSNKIIEDIQNKYNANIK